MKRTLYLPSFLLFAISCLWLSSCVTKGKYLMAEKQNSNLQSDSANTHRLLSECNGKVVALQATKDQLEKDRAALQNQNSTTQNDLKNLSNQSKEEMERSRAAMQKSQLTIEEQQKRLQDLQNLIQSQRDAMNNLKKTITDALVNFKADELSVYIKDGNVYVSLSEKLLFKSGSAVVDPKGKEALGTLAKVLASTPDIGVLVEGHTDTLAIKTAQFQDNWALSTGRAASIVRILTQDYGLDPHRITASGRGEFHPVKPNDTPEGRASNRRTEIILSPNLAPLYKLLGQGS